MLKVITSLLYIFSRHNPSKLICPHDSDKQTEKTQTNNLGWKKVLSFLQACWLTRNKNFPIFPPFPWTCNMLSNSCCNLHSIFLDFAQLLLLKGQILSIYEMTWGAVTGQCWDWSPPTNVARVRFLDPYVHRVLVIILAPKVFLLFSPVFLPPQKRILPKSSKSVRNTCPHKLLALILLCIN